MAKAMKKQNEYLGGKKVSRSSETNKPMPGEGTRSPLGKAKKDANPWGAGSQSANGKGYKKGS
ncbi:MAG: hypothetical protein H8E12_01725 [Rhodobacteraceae bacterium]|nr:hypothetical protein [Paracoccaceae bacterium]